MSLDTVELVMQCEQRFGISISDTEAGEANTVGSLFELICKHLGLPYGSDQTRPITRVLVPATMLHSPSVRLSRDEVWMKLVAIVTEQLQVDLDEVTYEADWSRDLGAD